MDDFEKAEFWEALNRLYTASLSLKEASEAQRREISDLLALSRSHENRLDGAEIYIQLMLEDARRDRQALASTGDTAREALEMAQASEKRLEELVEELKRLRERRDSGNGGGSEHKG